MSYFYAGGLPFKGYFKKLGLISSGGTIDISPYCEELGVDKKTITVNDILAEPLYNTSTASSSGKVYSGGTDEVRVDKYSSSSYTLSKTYNSNTGVISASSLTTRGFRKSGSSRGGGASCQARTYSSLNLYLFKEVK